MASERDVQRAMQDVVDESDDQSVYVYLGEVVRDHFPPSTMWALHEKPEGMALEIRCFSPSRGGFELARTYRPGEWTYVGRGVPGPAPVKGPALSRHGARQEDVDRYLKRRGVQ